MRSETKVTCYLLLASTGPQVGNPHHAVWYKSQNPSQAQGRLRSLATVLVATATKEKIVFQGAIVTYQLHLKWTSFSLVLKKNNKSNSLKSMSFPSNLFCCSVSLTVLLTLFFQVQLWSCERTTTTRTVWMEEGRWLENNEKGWGWLIVNNRLLLTLFLLIIGLIFIIHHPFS